MPFAAPARAAKASRPGPWTPQSTRIPEGLPPPARTDIGPLPMQFPREHAAPRERVARATEGLGDRSRSLVTARNQVYGNQPSADGVVVNRPAPTDAATGSRPPTGQRSPSLSEGLFGAGISAEKSLDEVILAYLAEDRPTK